MDARASRFAARQPDDPSAPVEPTRGHPQVAALRADLDARVTWLGVQGCVPPSWRADRTQAPTWHCASARCRVRVRLDRDGDDAAVLRPLRARADAHEAGRPKARELDATGSRPVQPTRHVVGCRAEGVDLQQRHELGQDERDDVDADIQAARGASVLRSRPSRRRRVRPPSSPCHGPP